MQETIWMQGSTAGRLNLMYHLKDCLAAAVRRTYRCGHTEGSREKTLYVQAVKMSEDEKYHHPSE